MRFHGIRRWIYCWLIVMLAVLVSVQSIVTAQAEPMRLLLTSYGIHGLYWSDQGRYLNYTADISTIGTTVTEEYFAYDIVHQITYRGEFVAPDAHPLSRDDYRKFGTDRIGLASVSSVSPDGRYIVYGKNTAPYPDVDDPTYVVAIGDRTTGESVSIPITLFLGIGNKWNPYSTALLIYAFGPINAEGSPFNYPIALIYNLTNDLSQPIVRLLADFSVQHRQFSFGDNWDQDYSIDSTGRYLLAIVYDVSNPDGSSPTLVVYDAFDPSQSKVIRDEAYLDTTGYPSEDLKAFSFYLGDTSRVLMVTGQGVIEINTNTGQETIIQPQLTSQWVNEIVFSPDGRWLAFTHFNEELGQAELYLLNVAADLTANLFTPTPTLILTETDYPTDTPTFTIPALAQTHTPTPRAR